MHVDNVLRTKYLATEAGDAVLAEFDDWKQLDSPKTGHFGHHWRRLHVDDIGGADEVTNAAARAFLDFNLLDHRSISPMHRRNASISALLWVRFLSSLSRSRMKPFFFKARTSICCFMESSPAALQTMSTRRSRA